MNSQPRCSRGGNMQARAWVGQRRRDAVYVYTTAARIFPRDERGKKSDHRAVGVTLRMHAEHGAPEQQVVKYMRGRPVSMVAHWEEVQRGEQSGPSRSVGADGDRARTHQGEPVVGVVEARSRDDISINLPEKAHGWRLRHWAESTFLHYARYMGHLARNGADASWPTRLSDEWRLETRAAAWALPGLQGAWAHATIRAERKLALSAQRWCAQHSFAL